MMRCIRCGGEMDNFSTTKKVKYTVCFTCELELYYAPKNVTQDAKIVSEKVKKFRIVKK